MGNWVDVGELAELTNRPKQTLVDDQQVFLLKDDERVFAIGNQCTHQGAGLDRGVVKIAGSVRDRDVPGAREHVRPRDGQGDAAAGHEAGARVRREGRGRPRLRSTARRRLELLDRAGFHPRVRTRAGRSGSARGAPAPVLVVPGTAPAAPASARRCRVPRRRGPTRRCRAGGSRRPTPRPGRRTTGAATSADVHGPMPGIASRRRRASSNGTSASASSDAARAHTARITSARRRSTPHGWKRKYGTSATVAGSGGR